jgi:hypothetical protein
LRIKYRAKWATDVESPLQHYLLHMPTSEKLQTAKTAKHRGPKKRAKLNPYVNKRWGIDSEVTEVQAPPVYLTLLTYPQKMGNISQLRP